MDPLEEVLEITDGRAVHPWSWPSSRLRAAAESLCGWLDAIPALGRDEDGEWGIYRHGAWGCRAQLYRIWSEGPVIR